LFCFFQLLGEVEVEHRLVAAEVDQVDVAVIVAVVVIVVVSSADISIFSCLHVDSQYLKSSTVECYCQQKIAAVEDTIANIVIQAKS